VFCIIPAFFVFGGNMAGFGSSELKVHATTPNFRVVFYNILDNFSEINDNSLKIDEGSSFQTMGQLGIKSYFAFSPENPNAYFSGANIQSYTFSNSIDDIDGSFSITVKEDTRELAEGEQYFMDQVKKLDVVEIIENGSVEFYGVVRTISIGATAGAMNKVITISGISAAGLLNMFSISTDVSSMSFLNPNGENAKVTNRIAKLFENVKKGDDGVEVAEVFRIVYLALYNIANGMTYNERTRTWEKRKKESKDIPFASFRIQRIFRFVFGVAHEDYQGTLDYNRELYSRPVDFLDCSLKFKYQLVSNLFNQSEVNIMSYFRGFLPAPIYEMFHSFDYYGRPKIIIREVPFDPETWSGMPSFVIDPSLITDYTLSQTDTNIFTAFFAYPAGAPGDRTQFRNANSADRNGNPIIQVDGKLVETYGFIPLDVNFIGWKPKDIEQTSVINVGIELSKRVQGYFKNLKDFWNGDVTFINMLENESREVAVKEYVKDKEVNTKIVSKKVSKNPRIGQKVKLCGLEFYVTNSTHSWRYGEPCKINLHIERGGKYDSNGNFIEPVEYDKNDRVVGFNPSSLSRTWSELLTKE